LGKSKLRKKLNDKSPILSYSIMASSLLIRTRLKWLTNFIRHQSSLDWQGGTHLKQKRKIITDENSRQQEFEEQRHSVKYNTYNNTHPKIIWKTILVYSSDYFSSSTSSRSKINDRPSLCSPRLVKIPTVRNVRSRVKFLPKLNKIPSSKVGNKSAWLKFSNLNYSSGRSSDWPLFLLSLARR
jgi:hypothetical protein